MGRRHAEHRHRAVAVELVYRPPVPGDLLSHQVVIGKQELANVLGIERLGALCEPHEVAEHDRAGPALLGHGRNSKLRPALVAELRPFGVLGTA